MNASGYRDVDVVITTRELGRMIREAGLDFKHLPEDSYDSPLGTGTGAAVIFGTTGGVMEAALRTVADVLTGENLQTVDYNDVRGDGTDPRGGTDYCRKYCKNSSCSYSCFCTQDIRAYQSR